MPGGVSAPVVIPLRPASIGKPKNLIDTKTRIEIKSDTPNTEVYFTVTGTKPDIRVGGDTILYTKPFLLPKGKQTIKAIAVRKDEGGDSNVVQKQFDVEESIGDLPEEREQSPTAFLADTAPDDGSDSIRLTESAKKAARAYIRQLIKRDHLGPEDEEEKQRKDKKSNRIQRSTLTQAGSFAPSSALDRNRESSREFHELAGSSVREGSRERTRSKDYTDAGRRSRTGTLSPSNSLRGGITPWDNWARDPDARLNQSVAPAGSLLARGADAPGPSTLMARSGSGDLLTSSQRFAREQQLAAAASMYSQPAAQSAVALPPRPRPALPACTSESFYKCLYCSAPRPADPFVRFCSTCGNALPPLTTPTGRPLQLNPATAGGSNAGAGAMGNCVYCGSRVPFNLPLCAVCEAPLGPQNQINSSVTLKQRRLCLVCGTTNPAFAESCYTCEADLTSNSKTIAVNPFASVPPAPFPDQEGRLLRCSKCGRINNSDARYCDWCGSRPTAVLAPVTCASCSATNHPFAKFCASCGAVAKPPTRIDPRNTGMNLLKTQTQSPVDPHASQWLPIGMFLSPHCFACNHMSQLLPKCYSLPRDMGVATQKPNVREMAVQTVGLFFPSSRDMNRFVQQNEAESRARSDAIGEPKRIFISAVSPGRGYWRQQVDHIVNHLKIYAQNSAEFRAAIGEHRMGKLLSALVGEESFELVVKLVFALKNDRALVPGALIGTGMSASQPSLEARAAPFDEDDAEYERERERERARPRKGVVFGRMPPSSSQGRAGGRAPQDDYEEYSEASDDENDDRKGRKKSSKGKKSSKTKRSRPKSDKTYTKAEKGLLEAFTSNGATEVAEIEKLIGDGANPNLEDENGVPLLFLAVRNKHADAIPILVQNGVNVNQTLGDSKNTALHEASQMGPQAMPIINALLGCAANVKLANAKRETPFDVATRLGHTEVAERIAAGFAQKNLQRLVQPPPPAAAEP